MADTGFDRARIEANTLDVARDTTLKNILTTVAIFGVIISTAFMSFIASRLYITPSDVQAEVKIVEKQQKILQLMISTHVETTQESIVGLDFTGQITLWSDGATEMFGIPRNQAIGYGVSFMIPAEHKIPHLEGFNHRMETPGKLFRKTLITVAQHSDGSRFDVEIDLTGISGEIVIGRFKRL